MANVIFYDRNTTLIKYYIENKFNLFAKFSLIPDFLFTLPYFYEKLHRMKRILLAVIVCTFAFISTNAQDKAGPKIEFKKEVHDYGTIENGADGTCEFKFKNTGNSDLKITNCRASCGCTVPSWPKEPIKPGKSASIKVKYDTKRTGGINKAITITSNAVNAPTKVVKIKGTIKPAATKAVGTTRPVSDVAPARVATPAKTAVKSAPVEKPVVAKRNKKWFQFWKKK